MSLAPIALFVYNRPSHTQLTIKALLCNDLSANSDLIIFSDASKNKASLDKVSQVREYIKGLEGFRSIQVFERNHNVGLAASVIQGVTDIVSKYGKVIVLEDDLVTSPSFLTYMNRALDLYQEDEDVISIHGYNYPINKELAEETFFLKGADCWGWATWKRGWDLFEADGSRLMNQIIGLNLVREFDFNHSYPYTTMLKEQIEGKNDSWAIRWYASAFLKNKYTLYPARSLVQNIGLDLSGTHSGKDTNFNSHTLYQQKFDQLPKIEIAENVEVKKSIEQFFKKNARPCLKQRILNLFFK